MKKIFTTFSVFTIILSSFILVPSANVNAASRYYMYPHPYERMTVVAGVLNIRSAPTTTSSIVGSYSYGSTFYSDRVIIEVTDSGAHRFWSSYISYSGTRRYVAVKDFNSTTYVNPERPRGYYIDHCRANGYTIPASC